MHKLIINFIMAIFILVFCPYTGHAQYTKADVLALSRCLVAECDRRAQKPKESAAIAWVLQKLRIQYNEHHKTPRTYADQVHEYCAVFDKRSRFYYLPRARSIRKSTFANPLHIKTKSLWANIRNFAIRFFNGEIVDPHPLAMHFGGGLDINSAKSKNLILVAKYCDKHGKWCNYFYRTSYRRTAAHTNYRLEYADLGGVNE
jgi:hypothetical protein